jgi:hypothetical protein
MNNAIPRSIILFLVIILGIIATQGEIQGQGASPIRNIPRDGIEVTLDKKVLVQWCNVRFQSRNQECSKDGTRVNVSTTVKGQDSNRLTITYKVSGGQIIGQGSNVIWDLSNQRPGVYAITVSVTGRGGVKKSKSLTKKIRLRECPECDPGCECPNLEVLASAKSVAVGETVTFKAVVTPGYNISFSWKVTGGKIVFKAADEIKVQATRDLIGRSLTATVEISGTNPSCGCMTTATETVNVSSLN